VSTLVIFIVAVVGIVVLLIVFSIVSTKKRVTAFTAWANQHGWTYAEADSRYDYMPWGFPFDAGHDKKASDILTAPDGPNRALCFTYRYKTTTTTSDGHGGTRTSEETHYFAIYSLHLSKSLPGLRVTKEGLFGKLARMVGMHDIEFESEAFNREFKVKGDDRKFASDVVNPPMMQFLLDGDAPGFTIAGDDIVLAKRGRLKLETVEPTVAYLQAVLTHVPNFVWGTQAGS